MLNVFFWAPAQDNGTEYRRLRNSGDPQAVWIAEDQVGALGMRTWGNLGHPRCHKKANKTQGPLSERAPSVNQKLNTKINAR